VTIEKLHYALLKLHEKNSSAETPKNLARYRSENNFVWIIKVIIVEHSK